MMEATLAVFFRAGGLAGASACMKGMHAWPTLERTYMLPREPTLDEKIKVSCASIHRRHTL